jgi:hypothetical protein
VGPGFEGPPQAYSFTFDDDGFCTRMSAGAVMDPSIGESLSERVNVPPFATVVPVLLTHFVGYILPVTR